MLTFSLCTGLTAVKLPAFLAFLCSPELPISQPEGVGFCLFTKTKLEIWVVHLLASL